MMKVKAASFHLSQAIEEILTQLGAEVAEDGVTLDCREDPTQEGLTVEKKGGVVTIIYQEPVLLFRGLGIAFENDGEDSYSVSQQSAFESNGSMIDCSRNAVPNVATVKNFIRQFALMGNNILMLYTEDTYEVKNQPYFGYMRGRYTTKELKELDRYAAMFGVELIPCIQTLAHLQCAVRWDTYKPINDTADILLVDDDRTYDLIEDMISSCRDAFSSNRINIGMDEAWLLGRGKYQDAHGYTDHFELMCRHLERVIEICNKYDFKPMMWSDLFFHMISGSGYTADKEDFTIDQEKLDLVPKGVTLIYWDYYSKRKLMYDRTIERHQKFNNEIAFAGGAWKWSSYAPANYHSMAVSKLALQSCIEHGINTVFTTVWGDNGSDASLYSVLPSLVLFAEYGFNPDITDEELRVRFRTCCGADMDDFMLMDQLNAPEGSFPNRAAINPCKYLLFQDPMAGLFDRHVTKNFSAFYKKTAAALYEAKDRNPEYQLQFATLAALSNVLELKSVVGVELKEAYDANDREALAKLANETLPEIAKRAAEFKDALSAQWMSENKPFGFEVQDIRIGGVVTRANSAAARVNAYLNGEVDKLEELACDRLYYDCRTEEQDSLGVACNMWHLISTGTVMAGI